MCEWCLLELKSACSLIFNGPLGNNEKVRERGCVYVTIIADMQEYMPL